MLVHLRLDKFVLLTALKSALSPSREIDPTHTRKSAQELAMLKKFYDKLPISPPSTVLSKEKWFPYSQYEFNRDGSSYAPSVPEVLSIELPTGFEAGDYLSSASSRPAQPLSISSHRSTATVVDFPSKPTSMNHGDSRHGSEERCVCMPTVNGYVTNPE